MLYYPIDQTLYPPELTVPEVELDSGECGCYSDPQINSLESMVKKADLVYDPYYLDNVHYPVYQPDLSYEELIIYEAYPYSTYPPIESRNTALTDTTDFFSSEFNFDPDITANIREDLAQKTQIPAENFQILYAKSMTWSNSCLDAGAKFDICSYFVINGWQIALGYENDVWTYRTGGEGKQFHLNDDITANIRDDLSLKLNTKRDFQILDVQRMTWPDGCLGLGGEGLYCTQALVEGWQIVLGDNNNVWTYRTDFSGEIFGISDSINIGSTIFDPIQYRASYEDLILAYGSDSDALTVHYFNYGRLKGRSSDSFDEFRYIASNPDLISAFGLDGNAATEHYLTFGFDEDRPLDNFDPLQYLNSYDELYNWFGQDTTAATKHYIAEDFSEGINPDLFPVDQYIASYPDLIQALGYDLDAGASHYFHYGRDEKRQVTFDPESYINKYFDLIAAFGNDLDAGTRHYILNGFSEQRTWT